MQQSRLHALCDHSRDAQQCNIRFEQSGSRALTSSTASWPFQEHHHRACRRAVKFMGSVIREQSTANKHICRLQSSGSDSLNRDDQPQQGQQQQMQDTQEQRHRSTWQKVQDMVQQHGPGAFFSYITFSNVVSVATLSSAWLLYTSTTGFTPAQAGHWPKFMVFYAGAYAVTHLARPLKLAIGLSGTQVGSALVASMSRLLNRSKNVALVVLLVVEAIVLLCCLGGVVVYSSTLAAAAAAAAAQASAC